MLIMSWNVAGLSTTVQRIHESYGAKDCKKNKKSAFESFLELHHADIVCLQEHKIPYSQLSNRSEPYQCATNSHYESFWSKATPSGMNGVVTYVRTTTNNNKTSSQNGIIRANANPLGSPDLDDQGRCLLTDHDDFVLFNVYVPCNGGHAMVDKMRFLHALERAMDRQDKPVILVGDLNITHRGIDKFWLDRTIAIDDILQPESSVQGKSEQQDQWKRDVTNAWPLILQALETKEVVQVQTTNPMTGAKFQKYRLLITVVTNENDGKQRERKVYLGKHEPKEEHCLWRYEFAEGSRYRCPRTDDSKVSSRANTVSLGVLHELVQKVAGISWDDAMLRHISTALLEDGACPANPPRAWINAYLVQKRNMVDVMRHLYPQAQGRYTCWNQNTNRRYVNEGARIDYIWVDPELLPRVQRGEGGLQCGIAAAETSADHTENSTHVEPLSEQAALCAATANGQFQPVSYGGEGIASAPKHVLDTQFRGTPHTGMVYTPPSFSDHIGVSVVLQEQGESSGKQETIDATNAHALVVSDDKETKRTQPHKTQRSIASFLTAKRPIEATLADSQKMRLKTNNKHNISRRRPNTILNHFGVATTKKK